MTASCPALDGDHGQFVANGDSAVNSIEVTYEPGVHVNWTLEVATYDHGESSPLTSRGLARSPLQVEQMIAAQIESQAAIPTRAVYTLVGRDVFFDDGSRIEFRWNLVVTDWRCLDCGADTDNIDGTGHDEYFMLRDELWLGINPERAGHLCIACTEARLGRTLVSADFTAARVNTHSRRPSERLLSRIQGTYATDGG